MEKVEKVKRVDSLTQEQIDMMPAWRDKWIAIGLQCGESDWAAFEDGVRGCYKYAKLEPPKVFIRVADPYIMAHAAPLAAWAITTGKLPDYAKVLKDDAPAEIQSAVQQTLDALGVTVVPSSDVDAISAREAINSNWSLYMGGQFWVGGWHGSPSYVSFFRDVCHLELPPEIDEVFSAYEATCKSACMWWPHTDFVMACERPAAIYRDEAGQLHSHDGKAISWPSGRGVYSWHGIRVPEPVILSPESITVDMIRGEDNAEVRRVMIERMGYDKYFSEANVTTIDRDFVDVQVGAGRMMPRMLLEDSHGDRFLFASDGSTNRCYAMPVPSYVETCKEAHESICGLSESLCIAQG